MNMHLARKVARRFIAGASTRSLRQAVRPLRENIEQFLSEEQSLADELFGPNFKNELYAKIEKGIKGLIPLSRKLWAHEEGARAEIAWVVKDRAEAMRNTMQFSRVVKRNFLDDLARIESALKVLDSPDPKL